MEELVPVNLPYRAEYAKTGRASCKGCKGLIDKEELKIAVMVQSRFHDGQDANWFHVDCFFNKSRPKTAGDIAQFETLRWEDQKKITSKIDALGGAALAVSVKSAKGGAAKTKAKEDLKDYCIAYAKSGKSTCRSCEEFILKKEIRVSKKDYESEVSIMYLGGTGQDKWHHLDCFVKVRTELGFFASGKEIPGYKDLDREDQAEVVKKLPIIKPSSSATSTTKSTNGAPTGKRKLEDKSENETNNSAAGPSTKKAKKGSSSSADSSSPLEAKMAKQSKQMFGYRDAIKDFKRSQLIQILTTNGQEIPIGVDEMLNRIGDIMTFGSLVPCKKCNGGQYVYTSGVGYQCQGYVSEYTKCMNITDEPERKPFKVPNDLKEEPPFPKYKFKLQKRIIQHVQSSDFKKLEESKKPKIVKSPLENFKFVLIGFPKKTEEEYSEKITEFGGTVIDKKTKSTKLAAIITTEEAFKAKIDPLIKLAHQKKKTPVVGNEFVETLTELNYDLAKQIKKNLLCSWMDDDVSSWLKSLYKDYENYEEKFKKSKEAFAKKETTIRLQMKDGAVVDPQSGLEDIGHVLKDGKSYFNCVLNRTSIEDGKNSYYKLQIIESDSGRDYSVFKAWGRIGTIIGGKKLDENLSRHEAIDLFHEKYGELTGNVWGSSFVKKAGLYTKLEIDYGEREQMNKLVPSEQKSTLSMAVQELVCLIFDVERMKRAMVEFDINLDEMPLGKISKKQVTSAYTVLNDATSLIEKMAKKGEDVSHLKRLVLDASNRFYSLIPHNFGTSNPPLLDNDSLIKSKIDMLENLLEIELAYEMLMEGDKGGESSVDSHYKTLKAVIDPVEAGSEEYAMLEKYLKNTHADTHSSYKLDVENIFKVNRNGENKRYAPFKKFHNRKLLWHGSRVTNYAGILSQGLRIAPPEAPVTGYMFGKGVYFADMVSKSANYCNATSNNCSALLLVCEVALGDIHEMRSAKETMTKAPNNCHSVKGLGATEPNPAEKLILPDGVEVPIGKPCKSAVKNSDLLYNEYIVYDTAQINIRYLMRVNFNFNSRRR